MTEHTVLIAGAGPTGLMLAGELALAGIDVAIVERRPTPDLVGQRAGGLHSRTIEIFDQRGIADRFLSAGKIAQVAGFSGIMLDMSDFPSRHPYGLGLWQAQIERILEGWTGELGVKIYRGCEVAGVTQDDGGVSIALSDNRQFRSQYLVGCDGGRSVVRKAAGIGFPGLDATTSNLIAEAKLAEEPPKWGIHRDAVGIHALAKLDDGVHVRVLVTEQSAQHTGEPTLRDLSEALIAVYGSDYGVHSPLSLSRFTDATRQAASYRAGRVFVAGDAAHIHPPDGGQGLQTGVQDAVNLGWKLAQVIKGISPDSLLDTYHTERHPVGARAIRNTLASVALRRADERTQALRDTVAEFLGMDGPRKAFAASLSGLDIRYELGEGHALLGRRMPDLDVVVSGAVAPERIEGAASSDKVSGTALRVYSLLHEARPVLLNFGTPGSFDLSPWGDRVRVVRAAYDGPWELPVIGAVSAPGAVLIRPDGYVAWVGDASRAGLVEALTKWFGAPLA